MKIGKYVGAIREKSMFHNLNATVKQPGFIHMRLHLGIWTVICNNIHNRIFNDLYYYGFFNV